MEYEENPFENLKVAQEWATVIESEHGLIRDKELYPLLRSWNQSVHPNILVEPGAGQGIVSENIALDSDQEYMGIEPSEHLVKRARDLYGEHENRTFKVGTVYDIPCSDNSADAVFTVNVWFHLRDIKKATNECVRILKPGGSFLVSTLNPAKADLWRSFYFDDVEDDGERVVGAVQTISGTMSRNTFYDHSLENIRDAFREAGLQLTQEDYFGHQDLDNPIDEGLFVNFMCTK